MKATYFPEITSQYFNSAFNDHPRLFWAFGYGTQRQSLHTSRRKGLQFQVQVWYYPGNCASGSAEPLTAFSAVAKDVKAKASGAGDGRIKEVFQIRETVHTQWGTFRTRMRLAEWLHTKLKVLSKHAGPTSSDGRQQLDGWTHPDAQNGSNVDESVDGHPATIHWKKTAEAASKWEAGQVDVTFVNLAGAAVRLVHGSRTAWSKPVELPRGGGVRPNDSFSVKSHERESWGAECEDGRIFGPWVIDVSDGIVQDILIEGPGVQFDAAAVSSDGRDKHEAIDSEIKNACGTHVGCKEVLGGNVIARFLELNSTKLEKLGITSAMDMLIFAYDHTKHRLHGSLLNRDYYTTNFAETNDDMPLQSIMQDVAGLLEGLNKARRAELLADLAVKATTLLTAIVDNSDDAALIRLPFREWATRKHIPLAAVVILEELGLKKVEYIGALYAEDVKEIVLKLKFVEGWWFERGVATTQAALKAQQHSQHGGDL